MSSKWTSAVMKQGCTAERLAAALQPTPVKMQAAQAPRLSRTGHTSMAQNPCEHRSSCPGWTGPQWLLLKIVEKEKQIAHECRVDEDRKPLTACTSQAEQVHRGRGDLNEDMVDSTYLPHTLLDIKISIRSMLLDGGISSRQGQNGSAESTEWLFSSPGVHLRVIILQAKKKQSAVPGADSVLPGSVLNHTEDTMAVYTTNHSLDSEWETSLVWCNCDGAVSACPTMTPAPHCSAQSLNDWNQMSLWNLTEECWPPKISLWNKLCQGL